MNFEDILNHPFTLAAAAGIGVILAGIVGAVLKGVFDFWTNEVKRRQDLETHVIAEIEKAAHSYYLMSNYAGRLSSSLNAYVETKRELQLEPMNPDSTLRDPDSISHYREYLKDHARDIGKHALFEAGKLYRVMTDRLWIEGGTYFLPDKWANQAIGDLHNGLMRVLGFDPNIILKYIEADTEEHDFHEQLKTLEDNKESEYLRDRYAQQQEWLLKRDEEASDNGLKDLRDEYARYRNWLTEQDEDVKVAAAYAQAYSDLFDQQMGRLYKDWHARTLRQRIAKRLGWEISSDPRKAMEMMEKRDRKLLPFRRNSPLSEETRELIKASAKRRDKEQKLTSQILDDIMDPKTKAFNAHLNLGWNYYIAEQYDLAIAEYEKARNKQPQNATVHNNLGNVHASKAYAGYNEGEYKEAAKEYREALRFEPRNAAFHANFGRMLMRQGDYEEAVSQYNQAIEYATEQKLPSHVLCNYYNDFGNAHYVYEKLDKTIRLDKAIQAYSQAITLNPLDPILYSNLADAYANQEKHGEAIGVYQKAIEHDTSDDNKAVYYEKIGELREKLAGSVESINSYYQHYEAIQAYREAAKVAPDSHSEAGYYEKIGNIYEGLLQWESAAADAYRQAQDLDENREYAFIHYWSGITYDDQGDHERALYEYDKAIRIEPDSARYHNQLGLAYRRLGRFDMAVRAYERALGLSEEDPVIYSNLGLAYHKMERYDDALEPLRETLKREPNNLSALLALTEAYAYGSQHDLQKALETCQLAKEQDPYSHLPYWVSGKLLFNDGNYVEAAKTLEDACKRNPDKETLDKLISAYQEAIKKELEKPELHSSLGCAYERANNHSGALIAYERAFDLAKEDPVYRASLHNVRGRVYYESENWELAIAEWKQALEIAPAGTFDEALAYKNLGVAYDGLGQTDRALRCYEQATRAKPDDSRVRCNVGICHFRKDRIENALGEFQEARLLLDKDRRLRGEYYTPPQYAHIAYNIGHCYHRMHHADLAEKEWQETVRLNQKWQETISLYQRWQEAATVGPSLGEALYNLGVLSYDLGDEASARSYWEQALGTTPPFERARQTLRIIKQGKPPDLNLCAIKVIEY